MIRYASKLVVAIALLWPQATPAVQAPEPGTYHVRLCARPCDAADRPASVATATVVILDDAAAASESVRRALDALPPVNSWWPGAQRSTLQTNACFRVTQRGRVIENEELLFGITSHAATRWRYAPNTGFSLLVYGGPDASYMLQWTSPGPLTRGEGWSVGPLTRHGLHRNAYFEAVRLGPPNVSQCEQRPAPGTRRYRLIDLLVFGDHTAPVTDDYPPDVAAEIRKAMQRSDSYRSTRPKPSGSALDEIVHGALVRYERRLFVMTDAPDAARLSVAYVDALRPCYEWEGYSDCPRREAEFAGQYRRSNPASPFREYLPLLEAHRWLCAAEGFDYEKDATAAAASRRSSAEALTVATASANLLVRTAARELAARPRCYSE